MLNDIYQSLSTSETTIVSFKNDECSCRITMFVNYKKEQVKECR